MERLVCDICHKKVNKVLNCIGTKYCMNCFIEKQYKELEFLRTEIFNALPKEKQTELLNRTEIKFDNAIPIFRDYIEQLQDNNNKFASKNERLKQQLAEKDKQLQNAVVPKFKINYIVWYIGNDKVQKGTIEEIRYYKTTGISYYLPNLQRETFWIYESELFATKAEAEEALKKLEENNVKD